MIVFFRVLGCTTVDNIRANSMYAEELKMCPTKAILPVIGGADNGTKVPIFSQARPKGGLSQVGKRFRITKTQGRST